MDKKTLLNGIGIKFLLMKGPHKEKTIEQIYNDLEGTDALNTHLKNVGYKNLSDLLKSSEDFVQCGPVTWDFRGRLTQQTMEFSQMLAANKNAKVRRFGGGGGRGGGRVGGTTRNTVSHPNIGGFQHAGQAPRHQRPMATRGSAFRGAHRTAPPQQRPPPRKAHSPPRGAPPGRDPSPRGMYTDNEYDKYGRFSNDANRSRGGEQFGGHSNNVNQQRRTPSPQTRRPKNVDDRNFNASRGLFDDSVSDARRSPSPRSRRDSSPQHTGQATRVDHHRGAEPTAPPPQWRSPSRRDFSPPRGPPHRRDPSPRGMHKDNEYDKYGDFSNDANRRRGGELFGGLSNNVNQQLRTTSPPTRHPKNVDGRNFNMSRGFFDDSVYDAPLTPPPPSRRDYSPDQRRTANDYRHDNAPHFHNKRGFDDEGRRGNHHSRSPPRFNDGRYRRASSHSLSPMNRRQSPLRDQRGGPSARDAADANRDAPRPLSPKTSVRQSAMNRSTQRHEPLRSTTSGGFGSMSASSFRSSGLEPSRQEPPQNFTQRPSTEQDYTIYKFEKRQHPMFKNPRREKRIEIEMLKYVNINCFNVRLLDDNNRFIKMMSAIQSVYGDQARFHRRLTMGEYKPDDAVVYCEKDQNGPLMWHRGIITKEYDHTGRVGVNLVDHGNWAFANASDLLPLLPQFMVHPPFALPCALYKQRMSESEHWKKNFLNHKYDAVYMMVKGQGDMEKERRLPVDLFLVKYGAIVDIATAMVKQDGYGTDSCDEF